MRRFILYRVYLLIICISIVGDSVSQANTDPNSMTKKEYRDLSILNNQYIMKVVSDIENLENDLEATNKELSSSKAEIKTLKEKIQKLEKLKSYIITVSIILGPLIVFLGILAKFCHLDSLDNILKPRIDDRIEEILPKKLRATFEEKHRKTAYTDNEEPEKT